ncbi:MAG: hypothetical protein IIC67_12150 [Thaumarchaeota archaeon]|nr:hypothetical protein [Nitrososphaerota archaeon]
MERVDDSSQLPTETGRNLGLQYLHLVQEFLQNLNQMYPHLDKELAIRELEELENRIQNRGERLTRQIEVDAHFTRSLHEIIHSREDISPQLQRFWDAQIDIAQVAVDRDISYHPKQIADENREKILRVDARYRDISNIIAGNENDDIISIYALFFIHNMRTEVIEFSFAQQFRNLLREMGLNSQYDVEEIFSATSKVAKGNQWRTDARAIRDALSHNNFSVEISDSTWNLEFNNTEEGYNFYKTFTKNEFRKFITDTDFLYRSSLMLVFALISMTLIKQHCIETR